MSGAPVVVAYDLTLSFGETPALRGASVSIAAGEMLAVMGPSGSGKSTLLHCLAGILVPDSGEVHFAGQRVDTMRSPSAVICVGGGSGSYSSPVSSCPSSPLRRTSPSPFC